MSRFPPGSSVLREVKMTRTGYAQLVGQKFFPPKVFGNWKDKEGTDEWRWYDVGMKIVSLYLGYLFFTYFLSRLLVLKFSTKRVGGGRKHSILVLMLRNPRYVSRYRE